MPIIGLLHIIDEADYEDRDIYYVIGTLLSIVSHVMYAYLFVKLITS